MLTTIEMKHVINASCDRVLRGILCKLGLFTDYKIWWQGNHGNLILPSFSLCQIPIPLSPCLGSWIWARPCPYPSLHTVRSGPCYACSVHQFQPASQFHPTIRLDTTHLAHGAKRLSPIGVSRHVNTGFALTLHFVFMFSMPHLHS